MLQTAPNTKLVYVNPLDDKTRPICLAMIEAGALTRDEIEAQFSGTFETAGGFNCRHRWSRQTSQSDKLNNPSGAKKIIAGKNNWSTPLTPKERLNV